VLELRQRLAELEARLQKAQRQPKPRQPKAKARR
jgi:BMFP domain-containing protein YqiC